HDGADRFRRLRVDFFERPVVEKCIHDDLQAAEPMIENEKAVCNHEKRLGQLDLISRRDWNLGLEEMDCFVPEKTDSAARKSRQFRTRDELITRHQFVSRPELPRFARSEEHTSELQSRGHLVCRLLL